MTACVVHSCGVMVSQNMHCTTENKTNNNAFFVFTINVFFFSPDTMQIAEESSLIENSYNKSWSDLHTIVVDTVSDLT